MVIYQQNIAKNGYLKNIILDMMTLINLSFFRKSKYDIDINRLKTSVSFHAFNVDIFNLISI